MISDTTKVRIAQFGCTMLEQLSAHEHQGDWEHWSPEDTLIVAKIKFHSENLERALFLRDAALIAFHSAAIANYSMKAWELFAL